MRAVMTGHPSAGWIDTLSDVWKIKFANINNGNLNKLKKYDLIFHYIISEDVKKAIPWTEVVSAIKEKYPDKKVMIFFDWEISKNPDAEWRNTFRDADLILHCGPLEKLGAWQNYSEKCMFIPIPASMNRLYRYCPYRPYDFNQRKKWIAIMQHTHPLSDVAPALMNIGEIGAPVKFFTGMYNVNPKRSEIVVRSWGVKEYKVFPRLDPETYFKELSDCYIAHDNCGAYVGWSRFVYECAAYYIPVVSNMNVAANQVANLNLCAQSPASQQGLMRKLMNDFELRNTYGFKANETLKYYCSANRIVDELNKRLETLGLNPYEKRNRKRLHN
jgi:hypothetical protein